MTSLDPIRAAIADHQAVIAKFDVLAPLIAQAGKHLRDCLASGGKILFMGNGGSAADSQHLAAEVVGRYKRERRGLAAIAITTDTSILTSVSNDYGFEYVFARQVEALCLPQDVVVGISTSGNSANVVAAIQTARNIGAFTIGMTGNNGGKLAALCDINFAIPSCDTPRVQEAHILLGHILCDLIDSAQVPCSNA